MHGSGQIIVNKDYQRKLVWKKSHKINFIDTILKNYPFPEVYLAPGSLDQEKIILVDEIVDGQQRLTTIKDYVENLGIFGNSNPLTIKRFSDLNEAEKKQFLNYEISVRYLKNVSSEQVREIFQRINKTDYALNTTERINAQYGDSEFVCLAKQIIEPNFESESVIFLLPEEKRKEFLKFFHGNDDYDESIFSGNDMSRMLAVQYMMILISTMDFGEYFHRNEQLNFYIEKYNEAFGQAQELSERLLQVLHFITSMNLKRYSRWFKKASLFTLIVELDKIDLSKISAHKLSTKLENLDKRATLDELLGFEDTDNPLKSNEIKYLSLAREAVNDKASRIYRGEFISELLLASKI
jgi:hypoxanthine phosphoribosyltransferase